ncbi:hypothetical protein K438DRAFT_1558431 [Mycena galopus ATCC 62051]|nr:hypothetical protein K438DRAFT_1558431 [Mycena galopus ATCC 62051]
MNSEKASLEPSDEWETYRSMSLASGGFGEKRADIWSKVLHATPQKAAENLSDDESFSHPDERQIRLDTDRSFVLYPVDPKTDKDKLQSELNELLVEIFRKRPKLNYFQASPTSLRAHPSLISGEQGYHDIMTVLLLSLPRELQLPCAEQLSLQRVRDSMGATLEPVLGLLRVMQNLLRAADPQYAELLERQVASIIVCGMILNSTRTSPLPYYALPNLLTLFSHDMPTLPLIQRVFDYLLCRPPIYVVYLASAIILCRKQEVERLEEEGDEGMMHSILSALPEIVEDDSLADDPQPKEEPLSDDLILEKEESEHVPHVTQDPPDLLVPSKHLDEMSIADTQTEPPPLDASLEDSNSAPPPNPRKVWKPKPRTLTEILNMSDTLYKMHPPADPSLQLHRIMGPQSTIFTWSIHVSDMPSSDEAERMVERLDLVVYPEPLPVESKERDTEMPRRQRFKRRTGTGTGTVGLLVGAGLVLGVAVAISVYSARQGGDPTRDWRKLGRWVGGVLAGASERVISHRA